MRAFLGSLLVVLAAALVPVALVSTWVHDDVDDTDAYVESVAPLADDADVQDAVVEAVSSATVASLQEKVPVGLPDDVRDLVESTARRVTESDAFPDLWREANRATHEEFRRVVHGDDSVADGSVSVDLSGVVGVVLDSLGDEGLPVQLLPDLNPSIALAADRTLGERRTVYQRLDALGRWPWVAAGALVLLAVALGRGWRGRVRTAGVAGLLGAGGAGLVLLGVPIAVDQGENAADPANRDLVRAIADAVTVSLHDQALLVAVAGAVAGVVLLLVSLAPRRRTETP